MNFICCTAGPGNQMHHPVEPATRERISVRTGAVLCSIFFGASVTEAVSVNLLPLTLAIYTQNPTWIFWILAINPAFGFIAQPLVGLVSDRVWTRFGRRAVFLILSAPLVALSLLSIPWLGSLTSIVLAVVVLQFFQDVINGSDQPLIADVVPPEQRTTVIGLVKVAENFGFLLVLWIGMELVERHSNANDKELYGLPLYAVAAGCQLLFVGLAAFFLREQPIERQERPRLTPARYVRDFFDQPMLPRIASAYFLRAFARTAVVGSASLYAAQTLQLSESEYGRSWGVMPFVAVTSAIPLGLLVERFAKHRVLQLAFAGLIAACVVGYFGDGAGGLLLAAIVFGVADMTLEVTHKAYMSDHYPADLIGQLAGAVNCFYAAGRTAALILVGVFVRMANPDINWDSVAADTVVNYRVIWVISAVAAIIGMSILATTRDVRHEQKSQGDVSEAPREARPEA